MCDWIESVLWGGHCARAHTPRQIKATARHSTLQHEIRQDDKHAPPTAQRNATHNDRDKTLNTNSLTSTCPSGAKGAAPIRSVPILCICVYMCVCVREERRGGEKEEDGFHTTANPSPKSTIAAIEHTGSSILPPPSPPTTHGTDTDTDTHRQTQTHRHTDTHNARIALHHHHHHHGPSTAVQ
jgi:hypothetical protein